MFVRIVCLCLLFVLTTEREDWSLRDAPPTEPDIEFVKHCVDGSYGSRALCKEGTNDVIAVQRGYWIGNISGENDNQTVMAFCKFCESTNSDKTGRYIKIDIDNQCRTNRDQSSILCSSCDKNSSMAISSNSYDCISCSSSNAHRFFLLNTSILIAFLLIIFVFDFSPASGALNSLVFFAQMTTTTLPLDGNGLIPMSSVSKYEYSLSFAYQIINAFWLLDFTYFEGTFCFGKNMEMVQILALKYVVALMTLIPVLFIVLFAKSFSKIQNACCGSLCSEHNRCLSHPLAIKLASFKRDLYKNVNRLIQFDNDTSIQTLVASCFLLSYAKFAVVTFYQLAPVNLYDKNGSVVGKVLFFEGTLEYPGSISGWRYVWLSIFFLCTIVIGFPILLLLLRYHDEKFPSHRSQCCTRFESRMRSINSCKCCSGTLYFLNKFLDKCILLPFQKDLRCGRFDRPCSKFTIWKFSFGIHDYRWYAGWYFVLRSSLFAVSIFCMSYITQLIIQQVLIVIALGISVALRPYKRRAHNRIDGFVFLLILIINFAVFYQYYLTVSNRRLNFQLYVVQYILICIPGTLIFTYFFVKIYNNFFYGRNPSNTYSEDASARMKRMQIREKNSFIIRHFCGCYTDDIDDGGQNLLSADHSAFEDSTNT